MARINELEERIEYLETKEKSEITEVFDRDFNAEFYSSGYVTDIEVDVVSTSKAFIALSVGGETREFAANFASASFSSGRKNAVSVSITEGGDVLSSRIRIKGIGVKLLK